MVNPTRTYGFHVAPDGVRWLLEGKGAIHPYGVEGKEPPVSVATGNGRSKLVSPHNYADQPKLEDAGLWDWFLTRIVPDPLFQIFSPETLDTSVFFALQNPELRAVLSKLVDLTCPIVTPFVPAGMLTEDGLYREMEKTNVQPLIVYDVRTQHYKLIKSALSHSYHMKRKVLFTGAAAVPVPEDVQFIRTQLELRDLMLIEKQQWNQVGSTMIKHYAKNKWPITNYDHAGKAITI